MPLARISDTAAINIHEISAVKMGPNGRAIVIVDGQQFDADMSFEQVIDIYNSLEVSEESREVLTRSASEFAG